MTITVIILTVLLLLGGIAGIAAITFIGILRDEVRYHRDLADGRLDTINTLAETSIRLRGELAVMQTRVAVLSEQLPTALSRSHAVSKDYIECFDAFDDAHSQCEALLAFIQSIYDGAKDILAAAAESEDDNEDDNEDEFPLWRNEVNPANN